jgi:hypothetical protein
MIDEAEINRSTSQSTTSVGVLCGSPLSHSTSGHGAKRKERKNKRRKRHVRRLPRSAHFPRALSDYIVERAISFSEGIAREVFAI